MYSKADFHVGQEVMFGRPNGEKTRGEIVKMNPKKAKVKILEDRGARSQVGATWSVPYSLMSPCDGASPKVNAADEAMTYNEFNQVENHIMEAILCTYNELSPENLSCDGELPRMVVHDRARKLNTRLNNLFKALGRPVSETVVYSWYGQKEKVTCEH